MKIAQTSIVVFSSKLLGSILGFIATIYFARLVGAEIIGIFALVLAVVSWLVLVGGIGLGAAMKKRISEGEDQGKFLSAIILFKAFVFLILSTILIFSQQYLEGYVNGFDEYVSISVVWFIVVIFFVKTIINIIQTTLEGLRLVHLSGLLQPIQIIFRSIIQITLVAVGFGLIGLLVGHVLGILLATFAGITFISIRPNRPNKKHFRSLIGYAKFAWLGGLKSRAFNDVDIVILGAMVPSTLVGVYSITWSLSKFLDLFGGAISQTVFPEISNITAKSSKEAATNIIEDTVAYAGLITIPGFIGGVLLSDRLLRIYGSEFLQGTEVLWLLLLSILVYGYLKQILNTLNAINRPELAFRVNFVFVLTNVLLNFILIWQIGWVGAAIASVVSASIGLGLSYVLLQRTVSIELPLGEISRQVTAAIAMGGVVWALQGVLETTRMIQHNFVIILLLVVIGAGFYTILLLMISARFRSTVDRNISINLPGVR